jgi:hypothetical protein
MRKNNEKQGLVGVRHGDFVIRVDTNIPLVPTDKFRHSKRGRNTVNNVELQLLPEEMLSQIADISSSIKVPKYGSKNRFSNSLLKVARFMTA